MYSVDAEKPVGDGGAGVAACSHEDMDHVAALAADEVLEQACHEACSDILESESGAMEEFERPDASLDFHQGAVELQSVVDYAAQSVRLHVLAEECPAAASAISGKESRLTFSKNSAGRTGIRSGIYRPRSGASPSLQPPAGRRGAHYGWCCNISCLNAIFHIVKNCGLGVRG